ncbi:protein serine/threonine phosphatase [Sporobolomyces salmoneus]|uniref:protein serine/threonine phosphatase n=1 Tax=Sporobolomyces salmoneus TaxID=183962 RepID=UPI0031741471
MEVPPTALHLPVSLPFPLTIHRLHSLANSQVQKTQSILTYSYLPVKPDAEGKRERVVESWDSPVEGLVVKWDIKEGEILQDSTKPIVHIREPCTHDVQWDGMCAVCGKDLTAVDYTGFSDTARATISMVHDVGGLTVSLSEAHRLESATTQRLLSQKKLSLIVDLDQTIVHATVDPTVGEWLKDPTNPNFGALNGVGKFKLGDEVGVKRPAKKKKGKVEVKVDENGKGKERETESNGEEAVVADEEEEEEEDDGCWYYIKMRPGLSSFLSRISEIYEMHVYTMGTRAYAIEVCKVIDPTGALFGGRILSRDESGSMTRKSLQRLFPCDTNMVVIIDDRADVWDGSPNLVKVIPYEFFVGIGDINAAFLPKKKELVPPPVKAPEADGVPSPASSEGSNSTLPADSQGGGTGRERITTTPPTSPEGEEEEKVPSFPLHPQHHETITDLLVTPSPTSIVSPALSDTSVTLAHAHDIELQISDRPLQKIADQSHAQHQHERQSNSKSPSPVTTTTTTTRDGDLKVSDDVDMTPPSTNGEVAAKDGETPVDGQEEVEEDEIDEAVLKDDDTELDRVFDILSNVHKTFYKEHDEAGTSDVAKIIPAMKRTSLKDCYLVFSGLVALGTRPEDSEYWKLAETFGAKCGNELRERVTHLVANQAGTAKVHSARKNPRIKIVYPQWLLDSVAHWTRLPEEPYLLPDPKATSSVPAALEEPSSPVRPELSDEEGEKEGAGEGEGEGEEDVELNMAEIDWGEAMAEMDDLLNETDDDATDRDDDSAIKNRSKKRGRPSTTSTDDESEAGGGGGGAPSSKSSINGTGATESPLQKRVKTARSRSSGLKTSLSAAALAAASDSDALPPTSSTGNNAQEIIDSAIANAEMSQASSSVSSDDEGFLASLEAELEAGFEDQGEKEEE